MSEANRNRMLNEITAGGVGMHYNEIDNSDKSILARGCDPIMAQKAVIMLSPQLGNPKFVTCTDDNDFLKNITKQKWNIIFFAPGACRYNAAKQPIPGGIETTQGWGLDQYKQFIFEHQGRNIKIVETVDERQIIPLIRQALE